MLISKELRSLGRIPLNVSKLRRKKNAMLKCLGLGGGRWDCGMQLVTNEHIQHLNHRYRNLNQPTDVLSFPFYKFTEPRKLPKVSPSRNDLDLGDLVFGLPYIQNYCNEHDITLDDHMEVLLAHGLCHLIGYDHETDDDYYVMSKAESQLLSNYSKYYQY